MMYTDDEFWMRTSEYAPVHLQSSPHHRPNNLWINDANSKQYSPTPFNISSTYSSSSSPVPDPVFLTDNMPNTSVIFESHYDTYFNNTENVHAPYQCMWNKTDDYSLYTFSDLQQNVHNSYNDVDYTTYHEIREITKPSRHKVCSCTVNHQSLCEVHSTNLSVNKPRNITTDYSIQVAQATELCDYTGYMIPEESNQNLDGLSEDVTNSSWFAFSPLQSPNVKSSKYNESFLDFIATSSNEMPSNDSNDACLADFETHLLSDSGGPNRRLSFNSALSLNNHNEVKICGKKLTNPLHANLTDGSLSKNSCLEMLPTSSKNINNNDSNNNGALMAAASAALANLHRRGSLQLWQFLITLLDDKESQHLICWTGRTLEFKLNDPEEVARLWGIQKNRPAMNYDKLSRSLRYYYEKGIMQKVPGERYVYRFVYEPELLFSLAFPGEEQSNNQQTTKPMISVKTNKENKLCDQMKQPMENSLNILNKLNASNSHYSFPVNRFNSQTKENNPIGRTFNEGRFSVKRRHLDNFHGEKKIKYCEMTQETHITTDVTNDSDNKHVRLPDTCECSSIIMNDERIYSRQNVNANNFSTSNRSYNESGNDFSTMNVYRSQNNLTDKVEDSSNWLKTDKSLQKVIITSNNESVTSHVDWLDNFTLQKEHEHRQQQQPIQQCKISENYHLMNCSSKYSNHQYNIEHSLLSLPNLHNKNDIRSDRQDYYLSEVLNEIYNKEQEKLSSSSSSSSPPPTSLSSSSSLSKSSFILSLNDRNMLSTPPPITVSLQNIYEMNYELLTNNDKLIYHPC
ncbi:hypothetical protein MN116_006147 [Schistosoma mekongi]|uniref:ETS domain-containing protein n=1 Tax=Schistosoma mekongi TaxID=38744 RepID=A0AAE1ZBS1_SCHME|nr:hypothetical protein MN116_006147 [Schistosoma mekongi]